MNRKIKSEAREAYRNGNFDKAFSLLWELGIPEFVKYCQKEETRSQRYPKKNLKKNWLKNGNGANYFWNHFFISDYYFHAFCRSDIFEILIHDYFWKYRQNLPELEIKLALCYPEEFIKAIRVNQVFLKFPERIIHLTSQDNCSEHLKFHLQTWKHLSAQETQIWDEIQREFNKFKSLPLENILSIAVIWFETRKFQNPELDIKQLAGVYNFFISLLLSKTNNEFLIDNDKLLKNLIDRITSKTISNTPIWELLEQIFNWVHFYESVLSPYCFNMEFSSIIENGILYLNSSAEDYYQFKTDGLRYEINYLNYYRTNYLLVEQYEQGGKLTIPKGSNPIDEDINRELTIKDACTTNLLRDLGFNEVMLCNNSQINIDSAASILNCYSTNRRFSYYNRLFAIKEKYADNWENSFIGLLNDSIINEKTNVPLPFISHTRNEFYKISLSAFPNLNQNDFYNNISQFIKGSDIFLNFSRFNYDYDVHLQPFISFGENLFSPTLFFANNDWFYTTAQVALRNSNMQNGVDIEQILMDAITVNSNWEAKNMTVSASNKIKGDSDIIITDGERELLLQLKRTYLRLNPKDVYFESAMIDLKAAQQLNDSEVSFKKENSVYRLKKSPAKWIITTSFENIGKIVNGCRKVNFFDLLNALRYRKFEKTK